MRIPYKSTIEYIEFEKRFKRVLAHMRVSGERHCYWMMSFPHRGSEHLENNTNVPRNLPVPLGTKVLL